jgi:hypothetical protein
MNEIENEFGENPKGDICPVVASESFEVPDVIDTFLHKILDIEDCAKEYILAAAKSYEDNAEKLKCDIEKYQKKIEEYKEPESVTSSAIAVPPH